MASSCGWHMAEHLSSSDSPERTICVPYVEGDTQGLLTATLAEQIERQGNFKYVQDGGRYLLHIEILDGKNKNIGFRYDPKRLKDRHRHRLIPDETRRKLLAKVTVIDSLTQKEVMPAAYIVGSCDFDHQNYSLSNNINNFSLGQLTDIDTANEAVDIPLYRSLAHNIALYLDTHFIQEGHG